MKMKRIYQRRLSFGIKPKRTPHDTAWAMAPGLVFELMAPNNFAIAFNIMPYSNTNSCKKK